MEPANDLCEPNPFTTLPIELFTKLFQYCDDDARLKLRAISRELNEYLKDLFPGIVKPDECVVTCVTFSTLKNALHVNIETDQVGMGQHFHHLSDRATKLWKRRNPRSKNMEYFLTIPMVSLNDDVAFFDKAKIGHFKIYNRLPFCLSSENMDHLKQILKACAIEKISLLFDQSTMAQISQVPDLVSEVQAKHIEFQIQGHFSNGSASMEQHLIPIIPQLAERGIVEVSVTACDSFGRTGIDIAFHAKKLEVNYDVIEACLRAEILRVNFDAQPANRDKFDQFFRKLPSLPQPPQISIKCEPLPAYTTYYRPRPDGPVFSAQAKYPPGYNTNGFVWPIARGLDKHGELLITMHE